MDQDTSQKDPQDTSQAGGATPPAQDQPTEEKSVEPTETPAEPTAEEPKPAEPTEAPAEPTAEEPKAEEPAAEEPKPEEPAEAPAEEPMAPEQPAAEEPPAEPTAPAEPAAEEPKSEEPAEETPAPETPAEAPAEEKPAEPAAAPTEAPSEAPKTEECSCPTINEAEWDKQRKTIDKTFYKTWSPRLFYYPFSFSIDVSRAKQGALNAKYTIPENPMVLDTGGMFWSTVMVEVENANPEDKNVVSLKGKEFYTKVSKRPWKEMKTDMEELKQELGKEPTELYIWYGACPKCMDKKEVKTVFLAA